MLLREFWMSAFSEELEYLRERRIGTYTFLRALDLLPNKTPVPVLPWYTNSEMERRIMAMIHEDLKQRLC